MSRYILLLLLLTSCTHQSPFLNDYNRFSKEGFYRCVDHFTLRKMPIDDALRVCEYISDFDQTYF